MNNIARGHKITAFLSGGSQLKGCFPRLLPACDTLGWPLTSVLFLSGNRREVDPWSLLFYMASFGGFVAFFLVISCFECCCCKCASRRQPNTSNDSPVESLPTETQRVDESPPPPYHLFAPPSYDTLFYGSVSEDKNKCEVYVVPIHSDRVTLHSTASSVPTEPT